MDRPTDILSNHAAKNASPTGRGVVAGCLIAGASLLLSVVLPPPDLSGRILHLPSICPFYQMTGLPCPGCGLTRAFVLISHGDWRQSLAFHPMGWVAYLAFLLLLIDGLPMLTRIRAAPLLPRAARSRILIACAALTMGAGAARLAAQMLSGAHHTF